MRFTELALEHESTLRDFLQEFADAGEERVPGYFVDRDATIASAVSSLAAWARGEQLGDGWVPCTTTFLSLDGELIGLFNFRHRLTPQLREHGGHVGYSVRPSWRGRGHATALLREAIVFARTLEIPELLLTCDSTNPASAQVIRKCGGVMTGTGLAKEDGSYSMKWTISC